MTLPVAVVTSISPLERPSASGNNIISDAPNSFTVVVKSVPRIAMLAVGVFKDMFCLSILFKFPVINLVVPNAKVRAIFDFDGSGS